MSDHEAPSEDAPRRPPSIRRPRMPSRLPFQDMGRDNFPGLDEVLGTGGLKPQPPPQQQAATDPANRSVCSSVDASLMDMSIGARASMTEHLRHIAKFGFDDSPHHVSDLQSPQQLHPSDDEWNLLLDGNSSHASWGTRVDDSFANTEVASQLVEAESIEVFADVSSDFFNSSRVYQLATPEKNKNSNPKKVTTRSRNASQCEDSETGSAQESDGSTMIHMFKTAMSLNDSAVVTEDPESSFLSFCGVDVSRISATNDSFTDARRSPDISMEFFSPFDIETPSRAARRDISFSTPGRTEHVQLTPPRMSPTCSSLKSPPISTRHHNRAVDREKFANLGLSPIAARAGHIAANVLRRTNDAKKLKSPDRFPDLSSDGSAPMLGDVELCGEIQKNVANLSAILIQPHSDIHLLDVSTLSEEHEFSASINKYSSSGSSISKNQTESSSSSIRRRHLTPKDRRRFRTVVPHRVFIDEPSDFPDQADDSFSVPSTNVATASSTDDSSDDLPSTSLLRSFDDVAEDREVKKRHAC